MKETIMRWIFRILGKDPEAVVVCFRSGDPKLADAMCEEVRKLEPSRRHFTVEPGESYIQLRRRFRAFRIGLAPVLFSPRGLPQDDRQFSALRAAAFRLAPNKILAYNSRLERLHLKWTAPIASWLFLRGVPLDRVNLRPNWLWPRFLKDPNDRTVRPAGHIVVEGRPRNAKLRSLAILTPYFPYPLSHGGAVRMFSLLREIAREFDVTLYAFTEGRIAPEDLEAVKPLAVRTYFVEKPRYREPRWSSWRPPEVCEYRSPEMARLLSKRNTDLLQIEYTYLASYGGDILVEHDVTFDLYAQVRARARTLAAWWDWWRWRHFETVAVRRFRRVIVMSEKDRVMLGVRQTEVIENGVDLGRFQPKPETAGRKLLFIGSFRHFPNIVAYRFLTEEILPKVRDFEMIVVAGPDPWTHWRRHTGTLRPPDDPRIHTREFVADVRPLYHEANLVLVPTLESAGTNIKMLEALAMERATVSTPSGCAGLGLEHGKSIWMAPSAEDFARGIELLLDHPELRARLAAAGRRHAEQHFDWRAIGLKQRRLLRELLGDRILVRPATDHDLPQIESIQAASPQASQWPAADYLAFDCLVAEFDGRVAGFLVSRHTTGDEREILNLAVKPEYRGKRIAWRMLDTELVRSRGEWFLEVRESNREAIQLYEVFGFVRSGQRPGYYRNPPETGIVMRFFS